MKTSNLPDALTNLHMPHLPHVDIPDVSFRDLSVPDVDTDAVLSWARGVLPWTSRPSFVRRNIVPIVIGVVVASIAAYVVSSRRRAASERAAAAARAQRSASVA